MRRGRRQRVERRLERWRTRFQPARQRAEFCRVLGNVAQRRLGGAVFSAEFFDQRRFFLDRGAEFRQSGVQGRALRALDGRTQILQRFGGSGAAIGGGQIGGRQLGARAQHVVVPAIVDLFQLAQKAQDLVLFA
ncbi:MAG: hypothetical protein NTW47_13620 [Proteobacteria bacterium]|nr:hypothetical protein [Pseudomonadota bacterium]